jgi:hypothetical protein
MNRDFEYLLTFKDGRTERSSQNKISSRNGCEKPVSVTKVPIEDIDVTLARDKAENERIGFVFRGFYPVGEDEMYYPGWPESVKLVKKIDKDKKNLRGFTKVSLIGNGGCENYWTTRGLALYEFPRENIRQIINPREIDLETLRLIDKETPAGFKFLMYLPCVKYTLHGAKGDYERSLEFGGQLTPELRKNNPGTYIKKKLIYTDWPPHGEAFYIAKKQNNLVEQVQKKPKKIS